MEFTEEEKKKIDKLPVVLRMALDTLVNAVRKILNDECDESIATNTMATVNANAQSRFADEDLVNYEEAAKILGLSVTNRMRFKSIMNKHNIRQVVIHNQKVGFRRDEILALRTKLFKKR